MGTLVQQKQQISTLEVECNLLRNMVVNLCKDAQLGASNQKMLVNSRTRGVKGRGYCASIDRGHGDWEP
jgi:hypothetical protein